jgi:hypothetical protein
MASGTKILATAVLAAAVLGLGFTEAEAASRRCRQIEAQLASTGGGSGRAAKYDKAVAAQEGQLARARAQARDAGCGLSFLGMGKERCAPLRSAIERMQGNLAALKKKRGELGGGGPSRAEKARLRAEYEANGCGEAQVASRSQPAARGNGRGLFDQLFGGQIRTREEFEQDTARLGGYGELDPDRQRVILRPGSDEMVTVNGGYRTLCVRTCDGYYFPISGASSELDFQRDQKNCEAMCPGTEVKLYHHRATSEESEAMVAAADGKPYTELATAFLYRNTDTPRDQSCGCNPQKNFTVIAGELPMSQPVEPVVPQPVPRPDPAADPETLANVEGGLTADAMRKLLKPKPAVDSNPKTASTGPTRIRVVGPVFLPDPEGAIDLRAPGQKKAQ